ncbi:mitochondrial half-size ABC transporter [Lentinula edodes]|nr:mitochondrial half-size ABC transporter [Lentinula edodes]
MYPTGSPIVIVHVISPAFVFFSSLSLFFLRPLPPTSPSPITSVVISRRIPRRASILLFLTLCSLTYLGDGLTFIVHAIIQHNWPWYSGIEVNALLGVVAFSGLAALGTWKDLHGLRIWDLKRVSFSVALSLVLDIALVIMIGLNFRQGRLPYTEKHLAGFPSSLSLVMLLHLAFPIFRIILLVPFLTSLLTPRVVYTSVHEESGSEEIPTDSSLLLPASAASQTSTGLLAVPVPSENAKYGTFRPTYSALLQSTPTTRAPTPAPSQNVNEKPEIVLEPSWSELMQRIQHLSPYLWPSKSRSLQLIAILCILILLCGRFVNAIMPFTVGELIKVFEKRSSYSMWPLLFLYVTLRFLQGSGGLAALRDALWTPVMQYSDREMSELSFNHLLNLSFAFHTRRKTGEILRVLDRGAAINHTLELIMFSIIPTFVDIAIALVMFCLIFDWILAVVIFFVMFAYVSASVVLTQWRTRIRRQMNERDIITRGIHTDCLLNYETVKYFGGEEHEAARYHDAIREYQVLEARVIISLNLLNLVQNFIITSGLLVGSIIVARRVVRGDLDPSDFVVFIVYLAQLYGPLNQLGTIYRSINQSLVDTEKLLKLLNEPTEVNDIPDAPDLIVENGEIEFDNVSFSYDDRTTALNGVSFKVPKNSSVALVGESGSGKSTILRLLYRFYDLGEGQGRILVDGKDIREVTQKSLRHAIGVVPQDSVLFNTSIRYNIGYGKFGSSTEEIEAAAKSAQMHDRILSFPQGYETVVGERGVRLSGGEKQRVAIARTLLKNPPILLLDEATSALDTSTEKDIQKALQNLMLGRSSLSIAHRLSTIANADIILVLKDGQIVEQGSHKELLALDGVFASMWADQISASDDPAFSIHSVKPEVSGYSAGPSESTEQVVLPEAENVGAYVEVPAPEIDLKESAVVTTESKPEPEPESIVTEEPAPTAPEQEAIPIANPIAFPSAEPEEEPTVPLGVTSEPTSPIIAFPISDETQSTTRTTPTSPVLAGVTFEATSGSPRSGTPDPDAEPKRKRISSQNFQRLARRISISTRRQGSVASIIPGIPGLKRDSSPRVSVDDGAASSSARGEGSVHDSPAPSLGEDLDKTKKKKKISKKEKKKTT